jgi:hypothetical protein
MHTPAEGASNWGVQKRRQRKPAKHNLNGAIIVPWVNVLGAPPCPCIHSTSSLPGIERFAGNYGKGLEEIATIVEETVR